MADRLGQQFGNYRLVSLLGQGGYAEVYLGQHVRFNQQAAIKVLHAHLSGIEAEHFQQEAETIATLAHPLDHPCPRFRCAGWRPVSGDRLCPQWHFTTALSQR